MFELFKKARSKLKRDRERRVSLPALISKGARFLGGVVTAPLYLHSVDEVGAGVRTLGRPRIENFGHMSIGEGTILRSINVPLELATGSQGELVIGRDCSFNYGVSIGAMRSIHIGDRVRLGPYVMIIDTEFHDIYDRSKMPIARPVVIEDDVFIGAKASVMPGVTIGRGSIVGTSAVVTADVPPFTVVVGIPAKEVRKLDPEKLVVPPGARSTQ